jgi:hypothetical protein
LAPTSSTPGSAGPAARPDGGILSFFKQLAELSLITGALLYLSGWSYLFGYFRAFGLTVGDLTLPVQVALAFSAPVILGWPSILLISSALILVGLTLRLLPLRFQSERAAGILLLICLLVAGRYLSSNGVKKGEEEAAHNMISATSVLPVITLSLKPNATLFSCANGEDRLLLHANSNYYVFNILSAPRIDQTLKGKQLSVCIVPESEVHTVKIEAAL